MKIKYIFLIVSMSFVLFGCKKDTQNHFYSCNENVNNWVIENKSDLVKMTRKDLLRFSDDYQRPIFRAFTPKQRLGCWYEKLNEVLVLNWNENEKNHIQLLVHSLDENWFIENDPADTVYHQMSRDIFLKNWIEKGINELNWTRALIHSMVVCMETKISSEGYLLETTNNNESLKGSDQGTCECSTESDWCNLGMNELGSCVQGLNNCKTSSLGCGTLWSFTCNGKCRLGIIEE